MAREKLFAKLPPDIESESTPHRRFTALASKALSITPAEFARREREWNARADQRKHAQHKRKRRHPT